MNKTEKTEGKNSEKKILRFIKENTVASILVLGIFVVLVIGIILTIVFKSSNIAIGTSVIRDINITLISTMATLLGLYVTAFIFLYDSMKTRSHEDNTLRDSINNILHSCRLKMLLFSVFTILAIVLEVICNVILGDLSRGTDGHFENIIILIGDEMWWLFMFSTAISVAIISIIICASRDIMDSDQLISNQANRRLDECAAEITKRFRVLTENTNTSEQNLFYNIIGGKDAEKSFFKAISDAEYALSSAYLGIQVTKGSNIIIPYVENTTTDEEFVINFGKTVRLIEMIISRICDNNIDKSIMTGALVIDSMESGFKWLYAKESELDNTILDIRDENRFLDYLKYQLLRDKHYKDVPFNNKSFEEDFSNLKALFMNISFGTQADDASDQDQTQKTIIKKYKNTMRVLITDFFDGYKFLIGYRDALVHRYNASAKKDAKDIDEIRGSDTPITQEQKEILTYAYTLRRALIDRFTSFVKINDLNLGNSTLSKGWFNYSELSDSNFTHSSFRFARLENAIMRKCDLSTCNFVCADASGTDFTESNFNYSNLTGMDLTESTLNKAQMDSVLFRDARIDHYKGLRALFDCLSSEDQIPTVINAIEEYNKTPLSDKEHEQLRSGDAIVSLIRSWNDLYKKDLGQAKTQYSISSLMNEVVQNFPSSASEVSNDEANRIPEAIRNFYRYRNLSKINKEIFNLLDEARQAEDNKGKTIKAKREGWYGKIYFPVACLKAASVNEVSLKESDFSHIDMSTASFRDSDLSTADMYYTTANATTFFKTNLSRLDAFRSEFRRTTFAESNMIEAVLSDCTLEACNFEKALLINAKFINTTDFCGGRSVISLLTKMKNEKAPNGSIYREIESVIEDLDGTKDETETTKNILKQNCVDCKFDSAIADNILFVNCNLQRSNFRDASLRNFLVFNSNMRRCDFYKAYMSNGTAIGTSFYQANMKKSRLTQSSFYACDFVGASLAKANFTSSSMERIIFDETSFDECNLSSVHFKNCTLSCCSLDKAILVNTKFENVIFDDIDFSTAIGLQHAVFIRCTFTYDHGKSFHNEEDLTINEKTSGVPCTLFHDGENEFGRNVYSGNDI